MTDLPVKNNQSGVSPSQPGSTPALSNQVKATSTTPVKSQKKPSDQQISVGGMNKEVGGGIEISFDEFAKSAETGKDVVLPKEVSQAGVKQTPTVVAIPQNLQSHGMSPAGDNVTLGNGQSITLPLTDDQVQQGLKKSITESWRWLAEWCQRMLKLKAPAKQKRA